MIAKPLLILVALVALAVPIAASLGWLGLTLQYLESPMPLHRALGDMVWQTGTDFLLVAIPMFVLLGEVLLRAGITERMYDGIVKWLGWLPGGLMHSNIGSSALFAATSGSSVATAATIGTVAVPQIQKRGYNEPLFLGTVAAGGTLGILIPPSINLILYGLLTDTSVPELYLAGFLPGFLLALLFMLTVVVLCWLRPLWGGEAVKANWSDRFRALPSLIPPIGIFLVVVGSIYAGIATPTEAASLGVVAAMVLAAFNRKLTLAMLRAAVDHAYDIDDHADHSCGSFPQFRAVRHWPDAGAGGLRDRPGARAFSHLADDRRDPGVARLFYGNALHASHHRAADHADYHRLGLRPGLVRHSSHGLAGDRVDHTAHRDQSLCRPRRQTTRRYAGCHERRRPFRDHHVCDDRAAAGLPANRSLAAVADILNARAISILNPRC